MAPPKFDPEDPEVKKLIELFQTIGFSKPKATETAKSAKTSTILKDIIEKNNLSSRSPDEKKASLISNVAIQGAKLGDAEKTYVVEAIYDEKLKSAEQVSGEFLKLFIEIIIMFKERLKLLSSLSKPVGFPVNQQYSRKNVA